MTILNENVDENGADTNGSTNGSEVSDKTDEAKTSENNEFAELKKANSSKDAKIAEYQRKIRQYEAINFDKKTIEEKLTEYEKKLKDYEQREAFSAVFKEKGLCPETFSEILNAETYEEQAKKFSELIDQKVKSAADKAIEEFKLKELEKVKKSENKRSQDSTNISPNAIINNSIRAALGR
jgi:chaperonin cofactor prefoldin